MRDSRGLTCFALAAVLGLGLLIWAPWNSEVAPPVSTPSPVEAGRETGNANSTQGTGYRISPGGVEQPAAGEQFAALGREELPARETVQMETHLLTGRLLGSGRPLGGVQVEAWRNLLLPSVARMGETVTDLSGRFSFNGLEKGIYGLLLEGPDVPGGYRVERVILAERQDLDLGDLDVPVPGSLSGHLVGEDGQGLAGVQVLDSPGPFPRFDPAIRNIGLTLLETVTDQDGRFSFESVVSGKHSLLVVSADHMDRQVVGTVNPGAHLEFDPLTLKSGRTLVGHVLDPDGTPILGAQVVPDYSIGGQVIEGVSTQAGGLFQLRGVGESRSLLVRAEGFAQRRIRADEFPDPLIIRLQRSLELVGRVEGHKGHSTQVELMGNLSDHLALFAPPPRSMRFPVEEDGGFRIGALAPPGAYTIQAIAEGLGASKRRSVFPGNAPVVLTILAFPRVAVLVRDERGRPVGNAQVFTDSDLTAWVNPGRDQYQGRTGRSRILRLLREGDREAAGTTDSRGRAEIPQDPDRAVALVVSHPGHLPSSFEAEAVSSPNSVEIVLQRAARLSGTLTAEDDPYPSSLTVDIVQVDKPESEITSSDRMIVPLDREGRFRVEQMPPGTYDVLLNRRTVSNPPATGGQLARTVPLLGSGVDERSRQRVELIAGAMTEVILETTPIGTIRGRVLHGTRPVPGAIVFAAPPSTRQRNWDVEKAHLYRPFTTTGEDGRFLFLYAQPGTWEFRVRHPDAPAPSSMSVVHAPRPSMDIQQDLLMVAGHVRGTVDLESMGEGQKERLAAYLFRLDQSTDDPFSRGPRSLRLNQMKALAIDSQGRFEFSFVPEGDWVMRLISGGNRVAFQRHFRAEPYLVTDLGLLRGGGVDVEIEVEIPEAVLAPSQPSPMGLHSVNPTPRILIRQRLPGRERGLFVQAIEIAKGKIRVEGLEPGNYELELVDPRRETAPRTSPFRTLVVRPDSTTEPASLSFR